MAHDLYLSSASPRRIEILEGHGVPFKKIPNLLIQEPAITEFESPIDYGARLALAKVMASKASFEGLILGVDTIVYKDNTVYGKPHHAEAAIQMLNELSGASHRVITTCALYDSISSQYFFCSDEAIVSLKPYNDSVIKSYVDEFQPFDKAGGYGIQEDPSFIDSINGDFYTIMGLPINRLLKIFSHYGIVKSC